MTLKAVRAELKALGIDIRRTEHDEFRVNYAGKSERYAAYETDLAAARDTGLYMGRSTPEQLAQLKTDPRITR